MTSESINKSILQSKHRCRDNDVLRCGDTGISGIAHLLQRYGLNLTRVETGEDIPGSFWGDEEAGLIGTTLLVRDDTPLHSVLHESCHYICMDRHRREGVHTDAGGDYDEENAVCYLQILLADQVPEFGRQRMFEDMDRWGYSFRLGSASAWFHRDADDAREYLLGFGLIDTHDHPTFQLRQ